MKIWVIGRNYPSKHNSMQGSFELAQAHLLKEDGSNEVVYIAAAFHPFKKIRKWGYASFTDGGLRVFAYSVFFALERMHLHLPRFQGRVWRKLLEKVEKETGVPDIIHIHYPAMITIPGPVLAYRKKGAGVIVTEHWTKILNDSVDPFQRQQLRRYVSDADRVICVGQPLRDSVARITGTARSIDVVPNFVSDIFRAKRNAKKGGSGFEYIVVGRLVGDKQIDKVVRAFSKAFADNREVRLTIVGDGTDRALIENAAKEEGIAERVELTGILPSDGVAERINRADALICYSKIETFGVPVIEAWAAGKPVIASDSLGFTEYWNEGLGIIVKRNDTDALIEAMRKVYDERERYDADAISDFAYANFGGDAVRTRLMQIYGEVAGNKTGLCPDDEVPDKG